MGAGSHAWAFCLLVVANALILATDPSPAPMVSASCNEEGHTIQCSGECVEQGISFREIICLSIQCSYVTSF